jgi:glycosyltransferase involved in cell wall biosynthesis
VTAGGGELVFSVIVPTKGRAAQLERCLDALSVLDFPPEQFEVIVVNDGGGAEIDRVTGAWRGPASLRGLSTEAEGPATARNSGLEAARGKFIAFTDDDCEPESSWLRVMEEALESNPGCAVGGRMVNGALGRCAAGSQTVLEAVYAHFNRDPAGPRFFATSNLAFPADELRTVGGFDEDLRHAEDRELCDRWLWSGRHLVSEPGAIVRHMREMTLRQFWRQHFGYGKGAWAIHRLRMEREQGNFRVEPGFYGALSRQVWTSREPAGRISLAALAITSQVANALGFARESLAERLSRPRRASLQEASQ